MKKLLISVVALLSICLASPSALAESNGESTGDQFKVNIKEKYLKSTTITEQDTVSQPTVGTQDDLDEAVKLIHFDEPAAPGRAPLQQGRGPQEGAYCLTTENTVGTLSLVPNDWADGRETPYNTSHGRTLGCVPLTPEELQAAGLETTEENGQTTLRPTTITLTTEDFETFPITPATPHQERAPHTLKNYNTNFYTTPTTQEFTTHINNTPIQARATPIIYTYTYGDGTTLTTTHPGYPLPPETWDQQTPTSHQYTTTGNYHYTLTTHYRGEYSINGGPWHVMSGTGQATTEPQLIRVWRTEVRLVDGTCAQEPTAWGCPDSTATPTPTW
ncbi:hypothetical protein [Rothia nasisuis]|uniref:hypothetical protein n=2 Tax=Rothia nasisuis TaxID=2109647 RepID=UPI0023511196|nr:hypothetical protein [Rothia nasisuis]